MSIAVKMNEEIKSDDDYQAKEEKDYKIFKEIDPNTRRDSMIIRCIKKNY